MTSYDIAAGASQKGLDALIGSLHADAAAREGLFKGTIAREIEDLGPVTVTYDVEQAPTFALKAPTADEWSVAHKKDKSTPRPEANGFMLKLPRLSGSLTIGDAKPVAGQGEVTVIGQATVSAGEVTLSALALVLDESSLTANRAIVNGILIPTILDLVDKSLADLPLPTVPNVSGLTFQPLTLAVPEEGVVIGTTLSGSTAPDLRGFTFPSPDLFVVCKLGVLNKVISDHVKSSYTKEGSTGPDAWTCSAKVTAKDLSIKASIDDSTAGLDITGTFGAYGELSGTAVGVTKAVMCPVGAAADAIADPSGWNKVMTDIGLDYRPHPLRVPLEATADQPAQDGTQHLSVGVAGEKLPSNVSLTVEPKWSKSVTGSALGVAASEFTNLVKSTLGNMIVDDMVAAYGKHAFSLPDMSTKVELPRGVHVKVTLSIKPGPALTPHSSDELLQEISLAIS